MPYTAKQHRLFEAAAHNPAVAKSSGIPVHTAQKMASEGIKQQPQKLAAALRKKG
jgi:hypothetical protein